MLSNIDPQKGKKNKRLFCDCFTRETVYDYRSGVYYTPRVNENVFWRFDLVIDLSSIHSLLSLAVVSVRLYAIFEPREMKIFPKHF